MANDGKATFLIVHGAWAGGWSWERVVDRLQARGHRALAPTLTGLGERSHLAGAGVDLDMHVTDIVNEILWKDLHGIVLAGHSYGGLVITGVAERVADRIGSIVYMDAFIPEDGWSFLDFAPGWHPEGAMIDAPLSGPDDYGNEADRAWSDGKSTPQPTATFTQKLRVSGAYQRIGRKTFVRATGWESPFDDKVAALSQDASWTLRDIACGHDMAIEAPDAVTALLEEAIPH